VADTHGIIAARGQALDLAQQRALLGRVPNEQLTEISPDDGVPPRHHRSVHHAPAIVPVTIRPTVMPRQL
jgi:hypothetical protein